MNEEKEFANEQISYDKLAHYIELRKQAAELYHTFGKVKCPALKNKTISFTSEGFNHLVYRIKKQERHKRV